MSLMFGPRISQKIKSGTPDHATPRDVFAALLGRLIRRGGESWVHFYESGPRIGPFPLRWFKMVDCVEVASDGDSLLINICPPRKNLAFALDAAGISIPNTWSTEDRPILFRAPKGEVGRIVDFLEVVFAKLFKAGGTYEVCGYLVPM